MTDVISNAPVLEVKNLHKIFKTGFWGRKVAAVQGLSMDVRQNEIFGFLGPNGAGKTTTIKTILGLIYPSDGEVRIFGKPSSDVKIRSRIGFMPENPYFYDYLTAEEFLYFYAQLLNIPSHERKNKTKELLESVGLPDVAKTQLRKFSKGMIQRIGLAQTLLNDPDLIILDEPMSGLDPIGRKEIRDLILKLKSEGKTVFFSTHILPDVEMICDRVGIIRSGKLQAIGSLAEIMGPSIKGVEVTASAIKDEAVLKQMASNMMKRGNLMIMTLDDPEKLDGLIRAILDQGGQIIEVYPHRGSLETYFMEAIGENAKKPEALQ